MEDGWGEGLGASVHSVGSAGLEIYRHSRRDAAASGSSSSLHFSPRKIASSSGMGEVLHSSPAGFKREASTMLSLISLIKGPCIFEVVMLSHREHLSWLLTL